MSLRRYMLLAMLVCHPVRSLKRQYTEPFVFG